MALLTIFLGSLWAGADGSALDLQRVANQSLHADLPGLAGNHLKQLEVGELRVGGVAFDIGPKFLLVQGGQPTAALSVGRRFQTLRLALAAMHDHPEGSYPAAVVLTYEGGKLAAIPLVYGRHLRDWWCDPAKDPLPTAAKTLWEGTNPAAKEQKKGLRICHVALPNPFPDLPVESLRFEPRFSAKSARPCNAMIFAVRIDDREARADADAGWLPLDLSQVANKSIQQGDGADDGWAGVSACPLGTMCLPEGGRFRLAEKYLALRGLNGGKDPEVIRGVPVGQSFKKLQVLHATKRQVASGVRIASYVLNYADGGKATLEVKYGEHLADWWAHQDYDPWPDMKHARIAWECRNATTSGLHRLQAWHATFDNPHPDRRVATIDYLAAPGPCQPFCLAISLEP